jgi:methyl coenzyme M reductase gamma subunit
VVRRDTSGRERTLLEVELFDPRLIRCDGRTLDAHAILLDCFSGIHGDLVIRLISVRQTQIIVLQINVQVRMDELVLDILPDYAGHLVAIKLDDRVFDLDLGR